MTAAGVGDWGPAAGDPRCAPFICAGAVVQGVRVEQESIRYVRHAVLGRMAPIQQHGCRLHCCRERHVRSLPAGRCRGGKPLPATCNHGPCFPGR